VDLRDAQQVLLPYNKRVLSGSFFPLPMRMSTAAKKIRQKLWPVNRDGAAHVARATAQIGSRLLFISSDYVFDGEKRTPYETGDPRNPINVYGRSKAEAESLLLEITPDCCIVRTSWLFGVGGKCFPDTMLKLARTQPETARGGRPARMPHLHAGSVGLLAAIRKPNQRTSPCDTAEWWLWFTFTARLSRSPTDPACKWAIRAGRPPCAVQVRSCQLQPRVSGSTSAHAKKHDVRTMQQSGVISTAGFPLRFRAPVNIDGIARAPVS